MDILVTTGRKKYFLLPLVGSLQQKRLPRKEVYRFTYYGMWELCWEIEDWKKLLNLGILTLVLMKCAKLWKMWREKKIWAKRDKLGELSKTCSFPFLSSLVFRNKHSPLRMGQAPLTGGSYDQL